MPPLRLSSLRFSARHRSRQARSTVWHVSDVWLAHFAHERHRRQASSAHGSVSTAPSAWLAGAGFDGTKSGRIWNGNWHVKWQLDHSKAPFFSSINLQARRKISPPNCN